MNFKTIHHIAIIASDYQRSKDFYVNQLGFSILRENYRKDKNDYKLDLKLDNCEIELFGIAFYVDCIEDAIKELNEKGIKTEPIRIDNYTNKKYTFFKDPDGLPLELHE